MSFVVARLTDDSFEEGTFQVLGIDLDQVLASIAAYLRVARPFDCSTGLRLVVPEQPEIGDWWDWMQMHLDDVEDIRLHVWSSHQADVRRNCEPLTTPRSLTEWVGMHSAALSRQHRGGPVDVQVVGGLL